METSGTDHRRRLARAFWLGLALIAASSGCASAKKAPGGGPAAGGGGDSGEFGPPVPHGPMPPGPQDNNYGPAPVQLRPVVLVLGPGAARGYAHAGVLRALREAKVPIGAIVGTEMGALVGALYGLNGTINSFEWALLKFKDDIFVDRGTFSSLIGKRGNGAKLEKTLESTLGSKDLRESKIPVHVILMPEGRAPLMVSQGKTAQALRAALAVPGVLEPGTWQSSRAVSAAARRPYPVSEAKSLGIGTVVVVDVLEGRAPEKDGSSEERQLAAAFDEARRSSEADLRDADLVLRPNLDGIGYLDYARRTDVTFRGKSAATAQMAAIRQLVGLPETEMGATP